MAQPRPLHLDDYPNDELYDHISPLFTDKYQLTMAYNYWSDGDADERAVFHMFLRKCPLGGEYVVFAGLDRALTCVKSLKFTPNDILRLKNHFGETFCEEFYEYLLTLDFARVIIRSLEQGMIFYANEPMIVFDGPILMCQLLETMMLNLVSFPSLVTTQCLRHVTAAKRKVCVDMSLRRAQSVDGAMAISKYSYISGYDGTSNVLSGSITGVNIIGTLAHAYLMSNESLDDATDLPLTNKLTGKTTESFKQLVLKYRTELGYSNTNDGELAAFIKNARIYPDKFVSLLDTYDTLQSGVKNHICVGLALNELGFKAVGCRLDSGCLSFLSIEVRKLFREIDTRYGIDVFGSSKIIASNEIGEETLISLNQNGHEIDIFGIGTNATCSKASPPGTVFKLVWFKGQNKLKFSEDFTKSTLPGDKNIFRLYNEEGFAIIDLMTQKEDLTELYDVDGYVLCCHPTQQLTRAKVKPARVEALLTTVWKNGEILTDTSIHKAREVCKQNFAFVRDDIKRFSNPTGYKVALDEDLFNLNFQMHLSKKVRKVIS